MKFVVAYVRPQAIEDVTLALKEIDALSGASISNVRGFGRGRGEGASDHSPRGPIDYLPRIRVEVACPDHLVSSVTRAIERNAHTGLRGDGKIYVSELLEATRISTGEKGDAAV